MANRTNWARMSVSSGGTGSITLAAVSNVPTFAQAHGTSVTTIDYVITHEATGLFEAGTADYNGTTHVLSNRTVTQSYASSTYGTSAIDVPTGAFVFNAPTIQSVVDLTSAQTLSGKTLDSPTITGGSIGSLGTDLAVADGGTGASTAADARTNLGLGTAAVMAGPSGTIVGTSDSQTLTNKTLTTPTIASFANATHTHENSAGGGTLSAAALASGTVATARLGSGSATSSTFLRGDQTWATVPALTDGDKGDITVASSGTVWTIDTGAVTTTKLGGDITTAGKALLDDADAAAQRTTLGIADGGADVEQDGFLVGDYVIANDRIEWVAKDLNETKAVLSLPTTASATGLSCSYDAPTAATRTLVGYTPFPGTITHLTHETSSGSVTATVAIDGVNVTGLSGSATSTPATLTASGANTFTAGQKITLAFSSVSSPTNYAGTLRITQA